MAADANRHRIIAAASLEEGVFQDHTGCEHPHHLAPDQPPALAGLLDLVAERDSKSRPEQLADVQLEGVVGNPCHRKAMALAQLACGQRDPEDRRCPFGILAEGLVEVAQPEEDDGVGVLALDSLVLLEDRRGFQDRTDPRNCQALADSTRTARTAGHRLRAAGDARGARRMPEPHV